MRISFVLLCLAFIIYAADDQDFHKLKDGLKTLYSQNPRMIPLVVRLVFHDLLLQNEVSGSGCIESRTFLSSGLNNGLADVVKELQALVTRLKFPMRTFTSGDVIAFAGKIAVETAYPCIQIPFLYQRGACNLNNPSTTSGSSPPNPLSNTVADYDAHMKYLGLNHLEFAILVIGGHGIKDAAAHRSVSGWDGVFSRFSSGKDFISQTFNRTWTATMTNSNGQYISDANTPQSLIRIPADMVFFPDAIPATGALQVGNSSRAAPLKDPAALPLQASLKSFSQKPRSEFDKAFEDVFTKLLVKGGGKTIYREEAHTGFCPENPGDPSPPSFSTSAPAPNVTSEPDVNSYQKLGTTFVVSVLLIFYIL